MTFEEWAALPEDEPGEFVDGELTEEEMPSFVHDVVISWLIAFFWGWVRPRGGFVVAPGLKLRVAMTRGRIPDLTVFFRRGKVEARGVVTIAPDIAVEVVSPDPKDQRRDRIAKLKEYAEFGIRYYWLVSPELRSIEVNELGPDGRYIHALDLSEGQSPVPGCEGLTLDVDALWREVEEAETEEPT
jgi:Uma2 family endonuclease